MVWKEPSANFNLDRSMRTVKECTKVSLSALWRNTTSPPHLHVKAWCPRGSRLWAGQKAHWEPWEVSRPSHHLTATLNSMGSRFRPWDVEGITDSQDVAWGAETDSSLALLAGEDQSKRSWKQWSFTLEDRSFWLTGEEIMELTESFSIGETRELKWSMAFVRCMSSESTTLEEQTEAIYAELEWRDSLHNPRPPLLRPSWAWHHASSEVAKPMQSMKQWWMSSSKSLKASNTKSVGVERAK